MTKKGENIYKRKDGRWEGRFIKCRDSSGRIVYGSVYGKKYTEVKEKLLIVKSKHLESSSKLNPYHGSCSDWIREWLTTKIRYKVKDTTYSSYRQMAEKNILPYLEDIPLKKVKVSDIQQLVKNLQMKQLSSGTIKNIFTIIKKSLKDAKENSFLLDNPCDYVELPKIGSRKVRALTLDQQRQLEMVAFQEKGCSPVIIALYSGMRIGEISGLRWSDINFEENLIHVNRTVSRITDENSTLNRTKIVLGTPKSTQSIRVIPFSNNLKKYLMNKKSNTISDYVIESENGLSEPRTITNRFKKNIEAAGLPNIKFHTLRHTFATRCLEKGIDIASLSQILGHQSIKMTLDTYTDSMIETRRLAMNAIDQLLEQTS